jgi:cell division protein FtsB
MRVVPTPENRGLSEPGLRRKAAGLASVIALIALVVGALFGDRGLLQLATQRQRARALARQLQDLREENRALGAEIEALKTDPAAIERLAREQLGLAKPGEMVFVLRDDDHRPPR